MQNILGEKRTIEKYMSKKIDNKQTKDVPRKKDIRCPHTTIHNMGAHPGSPN